MLIATADSGRQQFLVDDMKRERRETILSCRLERSTGMGQSCDSATKRQQEHAKHSHCITSCVFFLLATSASIMVVILTADEMLQQRLRLMGFDTHRIRNVSRTTSCDRFRSLYGHWLRLQIQTQQCLVGSDSSYAQLVQVLHSKNVIDGVDDGRKVY